jgi:hypothetical protein
MLSSYWLSNIDLGLSSELVKEWDQLRCVLNESGALIHDEEDKLMWIGGDDSGIPSVKKFYLSIINSKSLLKVETWRRSIWKCKVQLKIKLFIWLALEGKILTWDSLQKRAWEGLGHCPLCKMESETIFHLFKSFPFTTNVWNKIINELNLKGHWTGSTLYDCIKYWYEDKSFSTQILALICWHIWHEQNRVIFEDSSPSLHAVIYKTLSLLNRSCTYLKDRLP